MKRLTSALLALCLILTTAAAYTPKPINGSYYGTNYTVPFAHAYRALEQVGVDHKQAIDRDVYHMARLGLNAFRLHLWDVELTDSIGNLIENNHLDLLDYLISACEKRGISIMLTAQTNFGNGYPERNTDPYGAYSYKYDKCDVHSNKKAQAAQERYLKALAKHINPYTGRSYAADTMIIAVEINNEPCHTDKPKDVTAYINRMAKALRGAGWKKPILYNVSHNPDVTEAYYDAEIDGTTYQWYPLNLVSGHTKKGNFLPYLDQYEIPWKDSMKNYDKLARVIYEYDPADNLYSYLFPAAARTFRKEGFDWITQFAYDPIDIAWANTEYQTHYLNLAYTPNKALGMMVAAEIARQTPKGAEYGKYPQDTIFGDFLISARRDLAMVNDGKKYIHTNTTDIPPKSDDYRLIAGLGSSPIVKYDGLGAYFLDRLPDGAWRLEVMPDVVLTSDPFAKPSLNKSVGEIIPASHPMTLNISNLNQGFTYQKLSDGSVGKASGNTINVAPGVYIIANSQADIDNINVDTATVMNGNIHLSEYVMPNLEVIPKNAKRNLIVHTASPIASKEAGAKIDVTVATEEPIDSVCIFPSSVSFWREKNPIIKMDSVAPYRYSATAHPEWGNELDYNIVVFKDGKSTTYPGAADGNPLDWDFIPSEAGYYSTQMKGAADPIILLQPNAELDNTEVSTLPAKWDGFSYRMTEDGPLGMRALTVTMGADENPAKSIISKYIADITSNMPEPERERKLMISLGESTNLDSIYVGLVNGDGFTYTIPVAVSEGIAEINLADLKLTNTLLNPEPYPTFLGREFIPDPATATPLKLSDAERLIIILKPQSGKQMSASVRGVWLR